VTGSVVARAVNLRCRGHVHYARSRAAEAVACYSEAIGLLEQLGLEGETARTLSSGSQALIYLGSYGEAEAWVARARQIFTSLGDGLRLGRLASNLGNILFRQDRYEEALAEYRRALTCLEVSGEPRDVAAVLSNIAVVCTSLARFEEALATYTRAREWCVRHGLNILVAVADYNIAYLYYLRSDYRKAMELYAESRAHCREVGDAYHAALCDLDESEMFLELNLSGRARALASRAASGFEKLSRGYEQGRSLVNLAIAASVHEDSVLAVATFGQARKIFEQEGNRVWPALVDLYQALVFESAGQDVEAWTKCEAARAGLSGTSLRGKTAVCVLLRARLLSRRGRLEEALREHAQAASLIEEAKADSLRFQERFVLGQIKEQLGDFDGALAAFEESRSRIDQTRSRLFTEELRISFLKDKVALYESLVALSLRLAPRGSYSAVDYIEQAKSRSLAEQMAFSASGAEAGPEADVSGGIEEIRRDLNACYRRLEQLHLEDLPDRQRRLSLMELQIDEQEARYRDAAGQMAPAPALSKPGFFLSEEQIRASLPADAVLLNYYQLRGVLYVCLLTRSNCHLIPLGTAARVQQLVRLLHFQMAKFRLGPAYVQVFETSLRRTAESHLLELYLELIAPIRRLLNARQLIIAPYDFLHGLPFAALFDGRRFLIDDMAVTTVPSASVYTLCHQRKAGDRRDSLVMGVTTEGAPEIEEEARAVADALPGAQLFLNERATEAVLRERAPASRFIHIAAHGFFRRDNPLFSSIRLSDSRLNLMDLYRIPMGAELVTLSGCSTGLNVVSGGDELVGLMRGLLSAGARSLLLTLWDVNDQSTAAFMRSMYKQLATTGDKSEAVRSAMRELRESFPHPYYWAPFLLVGAEKCS
jgi:tetratricopeptide (TPR) repeat protein